MQGFDIMRIDGHTLRVFASVCETNSVSRTAELFEVNQSTISHTVDKLRAAVGDPLFVKSGRGITPTEEALSLLPRVQRVLADIEGLVTPQRYDAAPETKSFSIAIPTPALLGDMRRLHRLVSIGAPKSTFVVRRHAPRSRVTELLAQDEVDALIAVSGFAYGPTLSHQSYGSDKLVVFFDPSQRGPIYSKEEYANSLHGMVSSGGNVKSEVEKALARLGVKRRVSLVAPTTSMLGELIKGTDIIATMPSRLSKSTYRDLAFCNPPLDLPNVTYDLVWHRRYEHSGRNRWFRNQILEAR